MLIGIDFDNTIVSYDRLFKTLAVEQGVIPADFQANKTLIRDHLRATGREPLWTAMQGEAYGPKMDGASAFPFVKSTIARLIQSGNAVRIISHKTLHPIVGPKFDLHAAARGWLEKEGFWSSEIGMNPTDTFFEPTKEAKWARIASEKCDVFIDDLPEILTSPAFPIGVKRFLFDPEQLHPPVSELTVVSSWENFLL